jgi:hypothetical protein
LPGTWPVRRLSYSFSIPIWKSWRGDAILVGWTHVDLLH